MRTGSLRAATQADPGQRATPQKSRLARQGERPYGCRQAARAVRSDRARAQVGLGCGEVPAMRIDALNIATRMFSHNLRAVEKRGGLNTQGAFRTGV